MRSPESVAAMPCPICKTGLTMSDRQGVEIDFCSSCRGVWLDRGELDKIIERSIDDGASTRRQTEPRNRSHRQGGLDDDNEHCRPRKPKKSFLSELFD